MTKYLVPDGKHLPYTGEDGKPDHHLMGAAWAALHGGYRGNKYEGMDKEAAIAHLRRIYKEEGMDVPGEGSAGASPALARASRDSSSDFIACRAAVALPATLTNEIVYLPTGLHEITPIEGGIGKPIKVLVDRNAATEMEKQRGAIVARSGKRVYFDFNHEDGPASFWPSAFFWRDGEGVIAAGEWSASGRSAVDGKDYRAFSPVFFVDNKHADPAQVACRESARPNMGGLVNNPAFKDLPLWAKNAGAPSGAVNPNGDGPQGRGYNIGEEMTPEEIAALQAKNKELQKQVEELTALVAKDKNDQVSAARLDLAKAEIARNEAELKAAELETKNKSQAETIKARSKVDAQTAVDDAVKRGAVLPKDTKTQEALVARATDDPAFIDVIKAMQGNTALAGRITPSANGKPIVSAEAPRDIIKGFYDVVKRNAAIKLSSETHKEKGKLAREAAAIFAKDIEKNDALSALSVEDMIVAADVTDVSIGLLAGTLVLQRALPLLQFEYPVLESVFTDFSDAPGLFNQTEATRIVVKPAVQSYDTSVDSAGRPKGWSTVSPAQTVDVLIKLDEHVGVPIVFGVETLAQTMRRLFEEIAPQALYALGGYFVKKLAALFTAANFNAYAGTTVAAVTTVSGNASVTVTSGDTTQMYPGQAVTDSGNTNIPLNTYVASITDSTHFVMTQKAKASNSGVALTIGPGFDDAGVVLPVPSAYATYISALTDFNMASLGQISAALDAAMVPFADRSILLNASYYTRLGSDPAFNSFFAAMRAPEIITDRKLPRLQGLSPLNAPWFPSSSNRVGFAYHKAAALLKTRLPQDFTSAVGAMVPGSVTTVTAPSGISVLLVQYINLQSNYAEWRPEVMLAAAVGDRRAGLVVTSQ